MSRCLVLQTVFSIGLIITKHPAAHPDMSSAFPPRSSLLPAHLPDDIIHPLCHVSRDCQVRCWQHHPRMHGFPVSCRLQSDRGYAAPHRSSSSVASSASSRLYPSSILSSNRAVSSLSRKSACARLPAGSLPFSK